jgi:sec-independent protein translocase protein TatC
MVLAVLVGAPFASDLFNFFASPLIASLPENSSMIATQVTSPFMAPFKLLIFSAFLFFMNYGRLLHPVYLKMRSYLSGH